MNSKKRPRKTAGGVHTTNPTRLRFGIMLRLGATSPAPTIWSEPTQSLLPPLAACARKYVTLPALGTVLPVH